MPWSWIIGNCEMPNVGAEKLTQNFYREQQQAFIHRAISSVAYMNQFFPVFSNNFRGCWQMDFKNCQLGIPPFLSNHMHFCAIHTLVF